MEAHHHHPIHVQSAKMGKILGWSILLNLLFVLVEAGVGFSQGSLSLLSDAGHNLSDVFSLILVAVGFRLSKLHANTRFTYGYRKSTILISLLNAIILLLAVGGIIIEAIHKFSHPMPVNGAAVGWTAFVGIIVNGATTLLLMRRQKGDLNVRGAFLHMAADTLVSVGVVISGVIIACTGLYVIDPFISLCIALIILISTWRLLSSSLRLSLDGTPEGISLSQVDEAIRETPHVKSFHHVHVWAMSTTSNALTAHIVIDSLDHMEETKHALKHKLAEMGITHTTLEMETTACHCQEHDCDCQNPDRDCQDPDCHCHHS